MKHWIFDHELYKTTQALAPKRDIKKKDEVIKYFIDTDGFTYINRFRDTERLADRRLRVDKRMRISRIFETKDRIVFALSDMEWFQKDKEKEDGTEVEG